MVANIYETIWFRKIIFSDGKYGQVLLAWMNCSEAETLNRTNHEKIYSVGKNWYLKIQLSKYLNYFLMYC